MFLIERSAWATFRLLAKRLLGENVSSSLITSASNSSLHNAKGPPGQRLFETIESFNITPSSLNDFSRMSEASLTASLTGNVDGFRL